MPRMLLVAAAALVLFSGCSSAENDPNLAAAIDRTVAAGSSRLEVSGTTKNAGQTVPITCAGGVDYERERLYLKCVWAGFLSHEIKVIARTTYVRGEVLSDDDMTWYKTVSGDAALLGGTISFEDLLTILRAAGTDIRRVGEEKVRRVVTVQYGFNADCASVEAECSGETLPVEVWIDEESLVRRLWFRDLTDDGTVELHDFGADIVIEAPPEDQVVDVDMQLTPRLCGDGFGAPITVRQALDQLQRLGFSDVRARCTESVADLVWNTDRGFLSCLLFPSTVPDAPTSVRRSGADGADAQLELHNLTCTILTDSPTGEATIDKLEAAFAELERTVRS